MDKDKAKKRNTIARLDLTSMGLLNNFILLKNPDSEYRVNQPYIFEEIVFALCVEGECVMRINLEDYSVEENYIIVVPPNNIIEMMSKSEDLELKTLFFSFDFISDFINYDHRYELSEKIRRIPCLKVDKKDMLLLLEFNALISKLYHNDDDISLQESMIKGVLSAYLTKISSLYVSTDEEYKTPSYKDYFMKKFIDLVGTYHKEERSVIFYADKMNITSRNLSVNVYKMTGRTALAWINDFVITKIKVQLKTSNLTATQISEEYNFPTPSLFGRFFKKYTGMTPNDFRYR